MKLPPTSRQRTAGSLPKMPVRFIMAKHRVVRATARCVLALLLFAHAVLTAQACLLPQAPMAFADQAATAKGGAMSDCHAARPDLGANACLAQLTEGDQHINLLGTPLPTALPSSAPLAVLPTAHAGPRPAAAAARPPPAPPPFSLLFCSFQI